MLTLFRDLCSSVTLSQVSSPFGGNYDSGFGREGGLSGLDEYLTDKLIMVGCPVPREDGTMSFPRRC